MGIFLTILMTLFGAFLTYLGIQELLQKHWDKWWLLLIGIAIIGVCVFFFIKM